MLRELEASLRFCGYCGHRGSSADGDFNSRAHRLVCVACGRVTGAEAKHSSPAVLVLTIVMAAQRMLLIRRGTEPYRGKWAPPGGFVELGESLEAAAVREIEEEAGVRLERRQLVPHGIVSLPHLRQIYVCYLAVLDVELPLRPCLPESLDARWFAAADFPSSDVWEPGIGCDIGCVYERARAGIFEFYQRSDDYMRVFNGRCELHYVVDNRMTSVSPGHSHREGDITDAG
jgi:ADP-ribose pyrophosphatase YjhB (NUDIX family)